jgi:hypothetical protein
MNTREYQITFEYDSEQAAAKAKKSTIELYESYIANLKRIKNYSQLNSQEQREFDQIYKIKEDIRDGKNVIILTFENEQAAQEFIKRLKAQGLKFTIKEIDYDNNHTYSSPSPSRR